MKKKIKKKKKKINQGSKIQASAGVSKRRLSTVKIKIQDKGRFERVCC